MISFSISVALAAQLWAEEVDQLRSSPSMSSASYRSFVSYADVLIRLDRDDQARDVLIETLELPMRYSSSSLT